MRDKEARRGMREDGKEGRERKRGVNFHLEAPWWEPGAEQRRRIGLHFASAIYLHLFGPCPASGTVLFDRGYLAKRPRSLLLLAGGGGLAPEIR